MLLRRCNACGANKAAQHYCSVCREIQEQKGFEVSFSKYLCSDGSSDVHSREAIEDASSATSQEADWYVIAVKGHTKAERLRLHYEDVLECGSEDVRMVRKRTS